MGGGKLFFAQASELDAFFKLLDGFIEREVAIFQLFDYFLALFRGPKNAVKNRKREIEDKVALASEMQSQITAYLVECSRESISEGTALNVNRLVRIVTELESIADTAAKLIRLADQKSTKKVTVDDKEVAQIKEVSCKGEGACVPICPKDAIDVEGYTGEQIRSMIDAMAAEVV